MAGRIYPTTVLKPNTPLFYDGTDFRVPYCVVNSDGTCSIKTNVAMRQGSEYVGLGGTWNDGIHNSTTRLTYTIPDNKAALLTACFAKIKHPTASGLAMLSIDLDVYRLFHLMVDESLSVADTYKQVGYQIYLDAGTVITINTLSDIDLALDFTGIVHLSMFSV